jgi:hypothetical protein
VRDAITGATDIAQRDVNHRCDDPNCEKQGTHNHSKKGYHMNEIEPILKQKGIIQ